MLNDRFFSKVSVDASTGCWNWTATKNNQGYGLFRPGGTLPKRLAHRLSYEFHCEPIPAGKIVLHECDNPLCVNPGHLRLGTYKENTQDMLQKGRHRYVTNDSNPPIKQGSQHGNAKLDEASVLEIRALLAEGVAGRELARRYGVDKGTIFKIRHRLNWTHI